MKRCVCSAIVFSTFFSISAFASVSVSTPTNGATVGSPVQFVASSSTSTCSKGVASMGVYIDNSLIQQSVVSGSHLNTSVPVASGAHHAVVEEWDYCGGATYTGMTINVSGGNPRISGNSLTNLQKAPWVGWGEYPPAYNICSSCGGGVTWSWNYNAMGSATRFNLGGSKPYSDVLFVNRAIGQGSSLVPDGNHTVLPNLHNFVYDVYFFTASLNVAEVLEFDVAMYLNGKSYTWGNQCRLINGHAWDIWDNVNHTWVSANVPCYPINNGWNHLTIQMQRTSSNQLLVQSIQLNGNNATINRYFNPASAPSSWYGVTLNFQMDGDYRPSAYSVYLDKLTLNYW
ncbi:MAG: hypothetical protein JOZ14_07505 [Acidobacteria bacterium]|nr:hypothetical protein [Acidobacteriota bacterium]